MPPARTATRLLALALVCAVLCVAGYFVAVRTTSGQRMDDAALAGGEGRSARAARASQRLLDTVSVGSLALLGTALMTVAALRGRLRLAVSVGIVILGANVTTQALKYGLFDRPNLLGRPGLAYNTYPSGHATVAMSLAVAFILVVPARTRALAAVIGLGYSCGIGVAVLTAGWHRPSDSVGAQLVCVGWAAIACAVLVAWRGTGDSTIRSAQTAAAGRFASPLFATIGIGLLIAAFAGVAGWAVARRAEELDTIELGAAYAAAVAAIVGSAMLLVSVLLALLRGVTLDAPEHEPDPEPVSV